MRPNDGQIADLNRRILGDSRIAEEVPEGEWRAYLDEVVAAAPTMAAILALEGTIGRGEEAVARRVLEIVWETEQTATAPCDPDLAVLFLAGMFGAGHFPPRPETGGASIAPRRVARQTYQRDIVGMLALLSDDDRARLLRREREVVRTHHQGSPWPMLFRSQ